MKRTIKAIGAAAALSLALAACAGTGGDPKSSGSADDLTLRIGTSTEVVKWSPANSTSISDMWIMGQMYPYLFNQNKPGEFTPHVADSYEVSEDGSSLNIKLNPDFKWSDGEPITSADVAFSADHYQKDNLLGGFGFSANYKETQIVSDTELNLISKVPSYDWVASILSTFAVIPEHVFADVPDVSKASILEQPEMWVSGGSYTLSDVSAGQSYTFVPNEYYPLRADGNDAIKKVVFKIYSDINTMQLALENGDLDLMAPPVPASAISNLSTKKNITIDAYEDALNISKMTFNASKAPLNDPVLRQVVSGLVDAGSIVDNVLQGHASAIVGPVSPAFEDYKQDLKPWKYTPEEAKSILAKAGYDNVHLTLGCDQGNANHAKSAQIVRDALAAAGIEVELACSERATSLAAAKDKQFDLYIHKLNQSSAVGSLLFNVFHSTNPVGLNYTFENDPELDALVEKTLTAKDKASYIEAVKIAAADIHEKAYHLPLYVEHLNMAYNNTTFSGYVGTPVEQTTMVSPYSLAQVIPAS